MELESKSEVEQQEEAELETAPSSRSPMMQQWEACKQQSEGALLLFRLGDFYEAFEEDAHILSRVLGLTLTHRQTVPMAGIPAATGETYIDRLTSQGYRVAVAEQIDDPKLTKGLVRRAIQRIVTPGACPNSSRLEEKVNHYFGAIHQVGQRYGFALLDVSTGEFRTTELETLEALQSECVRFQPAEILMSRTFHTRHTGFLNDLQTRYSFAPALIDHWHFDGPLTFHFLLEHFQVKTLDGLGLAGFTAGIHAAGALLKHVHQLLMLPVQAVRTLSPYMVSDYLVIDAQSQRNLELTRSLQEGMKRPTLLKLLDETLTPMGGRLLAQWLCQPLVVLEKIVERHEAVEEFLIQSGCRRGLQALFNQVRDLERLITKIESGFAAPRDYGALRDACSPLQQVLELTKNLKAPLLCKQSDQIDPLSDVAALLKRALVDEPPVRAGEGNIFREGFNAELDALRALSSSSQGGMLSYQTKLRDETGIKTLKVGYNRLFGYYIEVPSSQADKVPSHYIRRQTLANAERYVTPELKEYEDKVLRAEEHLKSLELRLFGSLREEVLKTAERIIKTANAIAIIDVLQSFAQVAAKQGYVRPIMHRGNALNITSGRHPVVESMALGEKFTPNDTSLDGEKSRLWIITGPNMAGKSTYLRQVALIVILAQMGGFVPAEKAEIGIVDRLFTRIGASDDLARGQSTFMVEMTETAHILHSATSRSLVILDEIGRGTSTYDGISIAWSVAEYLLTTPGCQPKTLFATHYGELTQLVKTQQGALNYHVAVEESEGKVQFLRKIIPGIADKSYGIHVGALAGLPNTVLTRAREILSCLEESSKGLLAEMQPANVLVKKLAPVRRSKADKGQAASREIQLTFF